MVRITKPVEERRQEIIDTARVLFMENGFDEIQMADISKNMNVSPGTVYHYFKSKTELLYIVIDELTDEIIQKKQQLISNTQGSAFERLKLLFTDFNTGELHRKLKEGFTKDLALIQYYYTKISNSYVPLFANLIEQGNLDGSWSCEYPTETAVFIVRGLAGVISEERNRKDSPQDKNNRIKAYTTIVFRVLDAVKPEKQSC